MPFSPFALKRPDAAEETRTLTDPNQPGVQMTITLRTRPGFSAMMEIADKAAQYVADWVDGPKAGPLPVPNFGEVTLNRATVDSIARIQTMHVPTQETPALDIMGWAVVSEVMPSLFTELATWAITLQTGKDSDLKNG